MTLHDWTTEQLALTKRRRWGPNPGRVAIRARDDAHRVAARATTQLVAIEPKGVDTSTGQHLPLSRRERRRLRGHLVDGFSSATVAIGS